MSQEQEYSQFATALKDLIDTSEFYSGGRADWAIMLDVTEDEIEKWVTDRTLPSPETLRAIVREVESTPTTRMTVLEAFWQVAAMPAREVSPLASQVAQSFGFSEFGINRTFGHYLTIPIIKGFLRMFSCLTPTEQREVLQVAGKKTWEFNHARARAREECTLQQQLGPLVHVPMNFSTNKSDT